MAISPQLEFVTMIEPRTRKQKLRYLNEHGCLVIMGCSANRYHVKFPSGTSRSEEQVCGDGETRSILRLPNGENMELKTYQRQGWSDISPWRASGKINMSNNTKHHSIVDVVVVADNSSMIQKIVETCLVREGFVVQSYADERTLMEWLSSYQQQDALVFVLDIQIDGYTIVQSLRQRPETKKNTIIMLSYRDNLLNPGVSLYLPRPFRTSELVRMVRKSTIKENNEYDTESRTTKHHDEQE